MNLEAARSNLVLPQSSFTNPKIIPTNFLVHKPITPAKSFQSKKEFAKKHPEKAIRKANPTVHDPDKDPDYDKGIINENNVAKVADDLNTRMENNPELRKALKIDPNNLPTNVQKTNVANGTAVKPSPEVSTNVYSALKSKLHNLLHSKLFSFFTSTADDKEDKKKKNLVSRGEDEQVLFEHELPPGSVLRRQGRIGEFPDEPMRRY